MYVCSSVLRVEEEEKREVWETNGYVPERGPRCKFLKLGNLKLQCKRKLIQLKKRMELEFSYLRSRRRVEGWIRKA